MNTEQEDFVRLSQDLRKELANRERRLRQERVRLAGIALAVSGIGIFTAGLSVIKLDKPREAAIAVSTLQFDQLRAEINLLKSQFASKSPQSPVFGGPAAASFEKRLTVLEEAIMERPDKALAIPLLRKELDELARRDTEARTASRVEIDRLYEQQKWILGGIGTVLLAVAGGAISILLRSTIKGRGNSDE